LKIENYCLIQELANKLGIGRGHGISPTTIRTTVADKKRCTLAVFCTVRGLYSLEPEERLC
jgi:hypothetical protein